MGELRFDCNCDAVVGMEELDVGTQEILQYAYAFLPRKEVHALARGLKSMLEEIREPEPENLTPVAEPLSSREASATGRPASPPFSTMSTRKCESAARNSSAPRSPSHRL